MDDGDGKLSGAPDLVFAQVVLSERWSLEGYGAKSRCQVENQVLGKGHYLSNVAKRDSKTLWFSFLFLTSFSSFLLSYFLRKFLKINFSFEMIMWSL